MWCILPCTVAAKCMIMFFALYVFLNELVQQWVFPWKLLRKMFFMVIAWWREELGTNFAVKKVSWWLDPSGGYILSAKIHFSLTFDVGTIDGWIVVFLTMWAALILSMLFSIVVLVSKLVASIFRQLCCWHLYFQSSLQRMWGVYKYAPRVVLW